MPSSIRSTSICSCCVAEPRHMPSQFGAIVNHLQPRPTKPSSNHGLPVPRQKWVQQHNCPRCRLGRRDQPRAPNSGGGPLCLPLCFWATQTDVAPIDHCVGINKLDLRPYLPPHMAATVIQCAYCYHCLDTGFEKQIWQIRLSYIQYKL